MEEKQGFENALREDIEWRESQLCDLKKAISAADRGEFASAEEVENFFARYEAF